MIPPGRGPGPLLLAAVWTATVIGVLVSHTAPSQELLAEGLRATAGLWRWPGAAAVGRHWLALLASAAAGVAFWAALHGLGRRALRWQGADTVLPSLAGTGARVLIGLASVAAAGFGLGLAGLLFRPVEAAAAGLLAGLALAEAARLRGKPLPRLSGDPGVLVPTALVAVAVLVLAAVPETTIDALSYHIAAPEYFRSLHRIVDAPHLQYRWPLLTEQVLALLGGVVGPRHVSAVALAGIVALAAGWLRARMGAGAAAVGAAVVVASGGLSYWVPVFKPDLFASGLALLAVVAWDAGRTAGRGRAWTLCGVALGLTVCVKQSTGAVAAGLVAATALLRAGTLRFIAVAGAAAALVALPFLARTWWLTGNPAYPSWFGGTGWDPAYGNYIVRRVWAPGSPLPSSPLEFGRLFLDHTVKAFPLVLWGLPLAILTGGRAALPLAAAATGAVWVLFWPYPRYMMAGFLILALPAAGGIAASPLLAGAMRPAGLTAAWLIAALGLVPMLADLHHAGPVPKPVLPVVLGLEPAPACVARTLGTYERLAVFLSAVASPRDRILVVGDTRSAGLAPGVPVVSQDNSDSDILISIVRRSRTPAEIARRFRQTGVTLAAFNRIGSTSNCNYRRLNDGGLGAAEIAAYAAWWTTAATEIYSDPRSDRHNGGWSVYRISLRRAARPGWVWYLPGTEEFSDPGLRVPAAFQADLLRLVLKGAPTVRSFHERLGQLLAADGKWRESLPHLQAADAPGAGPAVYLNLGLVLGRLGRHREAAAVWRRGLGLFPEDEMLQRACASQEAASPPWSP